MALNPMKMCFSQMKSFSLDVKWWRCKWQTLTEMRLPGGLLIIITVTRVQSNNYVSSICSIKFVRGQSVFPLQISPDDTCKNVALLNWNKLNTQHKHQQYTIMTREHLRDLVLCLIYFIFFTVKVGFRVQTATPGGQLVVWIIEASGPCWIPITAWNHLHRLQLWDQQNYTDKGTPLIRD